MDKRTKTLLIALCLGDGHLSTNSGVSLCIEHCRKQRDYLTYKRELVAELLNINYDIAVRPGFHCAYPAHEHLGTQNYGTVRASLSYFNNESEIKKFLYAVNMIANTVY